MSVTDELIANAKLYAEGFDRGDLPMPPARRVAVLGLHGRASQSVRTARPQ